MNVDTERGITKTTRLRLSISSIKTWQFETWRESLLWYGYSTLTGKGNYRWVIKHLRLHFLRFWQAKDDAIKPRLNNNKLSNWSFRLDKRISKAKKSMLEQAASDFARSAKPQQHSRFAWRLKLQMQPHFLAVSTAQRRKSTTTADGRIRVLSPMHLESISQGSSLELQILLSKVQNPVSGLLPFQGSDYLILAHWTLKFYQHQHALVADAWRKSLPLLSSYNWHCIFLPPNPAAHRKFRVE